jgi:hypothetical protein
MRERERERERESNFRAKWSGKRRFLLFFCKNLFSLEIMIAEDENFVKD